MESILNFLKEGEVTDVCPKIVISSKPEADGLKKASKFGIPTSIVSNNLKGWDHDKEVVNILQKYDVNPDNGLVCLAGYMRLLSREFVRKYRMRIINIHPSLLPSFPGLNSQRKVAVLENDTYETLSDRILEQEHILYPSCVKLFSEKRLLVEGRKVIVT